MQADAKNPPVRFTDSHMMLYVLDCGAYANRYIKSALIFTS